MNRSIFSILIVVLALNFIQTHTVNKISIPRRATHTKTKTHSPNLFEVIDTFKKDIDDFYNKKIVEANKLVDKLKEDDQSLELKAKNYMEKAEQRLHLSLNKMKNFSAKELDAATAQVKVFLERAHNEKTIKLRSAKVANLKPKPIEKITL